jgi:hypothetical protein
MVFLSTIHRFLNEPEKTDRQTLHTWCRLSVLKRGIFVPEFQVLKVASFINRVTRHSITEAGNLLTHKLTCLKQMWLQSAFTTKK